MEKFEISVKIGPDKRHFEIKDYMHHDCEMCKYEVYEDGQFIGSFEPDQQKHLHVCKDAGVLKQEILNKIATELERYHV